MSQGLTAVSRLVRPEEGESRSRAPDRGGVRFLGAGHRCGQAAGFESHYPLRY